MWECAWSHKPALKSDELAPGKSQQGRMDGGQKNMKTLPPCSLSHPLSFFLFVLPTSGAGRFLAFSSLFCWFCFPFDTFYYFHRGKNGGKTSAAHPRNHSTGPINPHKTGTGWYKDNDFSITSFSPHPERVRRGRPVAGLMSLVRMVVSNARAFLRSAFCLLFSSPALLWVDWFSV